ncbi:MAG: ferritin-like domain-containing protein [Alphaproteobacteria bacterium]|nr:ferritin-like domain-containing protein [Alphaproteobacteria bacterium]
MSRYWTLDDIDWGAFRADKVDQRLLATIKAAALVEANAPDYVTYLCNVFRGDEALCGSVRQWGDEEVQHGRALARWASLADPSYDLDEALLRFRTGYRQVPLDSSESTRGSRSGELFARCVVESGTTSFYSAMQDATDEPVLRQIARNIAADEVRHYKLFRSYLDAYEARGMGITRLARLKILGDRIGEVDDDEFAFAYYAANVAPVSDAPYDRETCSLAYETGAYGIYRRAHLEKGVRMMLRAVGFGSGSAFVGIAVRLAWRLMRYRQKKLVKLAAA